jgi:Domain of unknown function (DUF4275)
MQRWRSVYAQSVKAATGHWTHNGFDWHAFSWNFSRAESRGKARASYLSEENAQLVVIPGDDIYAAGIGSGVRAPDFGDLGTDIYVFPEDLSWTMCFTHEDDSGIGPYFSRAEWCEVLREG